jgi:hypothetical protein
MTLRGPTESEGPAAARARSGGHAYGVITVHCIEDFAWGCPLTTASVLAGIALR